jgi:hypothetical protein
VVRVGSDEGGGRLETFKGTEDGRSQSLKEPRGWRGVRKVVPVRSDQTAEGCGGWLGLGH